VTTKQNDGVVLGGRYRIHEELGNGGMSTVHRAIDESLGRAVAVKIFRHGLTDAEGLARHREEVQLLASLSHPGLVTLFDAATDEEADCAFLVMELVTGHDLRGRLDSGALPAAEVAVIGRQLAEALAYTHARGVIHRDIKPGNILLPERTGEHTGPPAKLADFGIARIVDGARLTATGTVIGTAGYFSPEQALGRELTPASDVYSLGLVLLESLTGERAFPGSAAESMAARVTRDPVIPISLDARWTELLTRMTTRDPEQRPTDLDIAETLGMLAAVPTTPQPVSTERLDATKRFELAATEPHTPGATGATGVSAATARMSAPVAATEPASTASPRTRRSRRSILLIAAIVAAIIIVIVAVTLALRPDDVPPAPAYPAVEGELGESLEQLQRSVEP
jgi:serine/threonine protein kinase